MQKPHQKIFYAFLDNILSPPPNYGNLTYKDRLKRHFVELRAGKNAPRNSIHVTRFSFMLGLSYLLTPISLTLKKLGYRFVDIDLSQIGSAMFLDLLLREDALKFQTPKSKILVLASHVKDGNKYLLNLYDRYVTFIRNPFLKSLLSPFFVSDIFQDNSFRYDTVFYKEAICHDIWNEYREKFNHSLIDFPVADIEKAKLLLNRYVPAGKKFIALHVRDSGFYGDKARTTRNSDIFTYQKAIRYLIDRGYTVIRLGDHSADNIDKMVKECGPDLFDYAHSAIKSEMMDCYLISQCEFFIGGPSGPSSTPFLFGVSSCNMNWNNLINAPNFLEGDVTAFKKPRHKKDNSLVPFEQLLMPPLSQSPSVSTLDSLGLYLENNTDDEILATLKEFMEGQDKPLSDLQQKARSHYNEKHYAYRAKGKLPDALLKYYF